MRQARFGGHRDPSVLPVPSYSLHLTTWGLFHKTLRIHKLQICRNGQILTVNLLVSCKNSVIYSHFAVNYDEKKSFTEQFYGGPKIFYLNVALQQLEQILLFLQPLLDYASPH